MSLSASLAKPDPVPAGQVMIPYLTLKNAAEAIGFYVRGFGAKEIFRISDGARVGHAEISIGQARFMLSDEFPEIACLSPQTLGNTSGAVMFYVPDVDAFAARAVEAGAVLERPVSDEFYGDRVAWMKDPFGHRWCFASRFEEVSPEEMKRRAAAG